MDHTPLKKKKTNLSNVLSIESLLLPGSQHIYITTMPGRHPWHMLSSDVSCSDCLALILVASKQNVAKY